MKKVLIAIGIFFALAVTIIGIRMVNVPTEMVITQTLELPEMTNLAEVVSTEPSAATAGVKYAVAVDNNLAYSNTPDTQPAASTAKMILALMIIEKYPFEPGETGENITITPELYNYYVWYNMHNGSTATVRIGETISEYDALAATMLASANNLADTLAVWGFGSMAEYKAYAEEHLSSWGINNTVIGSDASGFSTDTTSTAADLAMVGQRLMQNPVLSQIVGMKSYNVPVAGLVENTNKLLGVNEISGVKTGYVGAASGYCLVTAYRLGEHIITTSVLGAGTRDVSFALSQNLVATIQGALSETVVATSGDEVGYYESWWTGKVPIYLREDAIIFGWQQEDLPAMALEMDEDTGRLLVRTNLENYEFEVYTEKFKTQPDFWQRLEYVFK
ncbi:D-alanyl-D-alanine carboxypeptidase [Candidatus Saccharibacteria bacterium]|nr:D-alanyl-D-alanine carboxypeptidase [Candidatus Saccharibacteria bacterium]